MEGIGDLIIVLSVFASIAALWFQWSSARAGKRALALLRSNPAEREPGLTIEVIGATAHMDDVEIRITNPASSWNLVAKLELESANAKLPADSRGNEALKVPFVIPANQTVAGHVFFDARGKSTFDASIVLVDFDGRTSRSRP